MTRSIIPFINPFQEANPTLECVLRNVCASDPDKNRTFGSGGGTNGGGGDGGGGSGGHANGSSRAQNVRVVHVGVLLANVRRCGSDGKPISEDASNGAT